MSLKAGDLKFLVSSKVHIDEFESKMGKDEDILVLSFKVKYNAPAQDLVNYFEKGYEWVMDADVSAGTVSDGEWLVFLEALRRPSLPDKLTDLMRDLKSLTDMEPTEWTFRYKESRDYQPLTKEAIEATVPLSPREYRRKMKPAGLEEMVNAAGIVRKALPNDFSDDVKAFARLARYR